MSAGQVLKLGMVVEGSETVLARVSGPALARFLTGFMPDPRFEVRKESTLLAANDNWRGAAADAV